MIGSYYCSCVTGYSLDGNPTRYNTNNVIASFKVAKCC